MGKMYLCAGPSDSGVALAADISVTGKAFGSDLSSVYGDLSALSVNAVLPRLADGRAVHGALCDDLTAVDRNASGITVFFSVQEAEISVIVIDIIIVIITIICRAVAADSSIIIHLAGTRIKLSAISLLGIDGQRVSLRNADAPVSRIAPGIKGHTVAYYKMDIAVYLHAGIHVHTLCYHIPARIHGDGGSCDDRSVFAFR